MRRRLFGGLSHSRSGTMIFPIVTAGWPESVEGVSRFCHDAPPFHPCDTLTRMRWIFLLAASAASMFAQLAAPNDRGIALGHIHLMVADPEAQKKLWVGVLGAEVTHAGTLEMSEAARHFCDCRQGADASDGRYARAPWSTISDFW